MSDTDNIALSPANARDRAEGERRTSGYANALYAESLAEFGQPLELAGCGGWILERPISGSGGRDAMGCYPLFSCRDWSKLRDDLGHLVGRLLTLALVVDPFATLTTGELRACFDIVKPFKEHYLVDLAAPSELHVTRHHRYYARKSLQTVKVQTVSDPGGHLEDWVELYDNLIQRHQLRGIKAFSRQCFRRQLGVPGLVMLRAMCGDQVVGAQLWYVQGDMAYSHLTALSEVGYASRASYGMYWTAIETFKERFAGRVRWLDLGGGAGVTSDGKDGLAEFKSGWATGTKPAFFCGKIFDHPAYEELSRCVGAQHAGYFPAYRHGEFF